MSLVKTICRQDLCSTDGSITELSMLNNDERYSEGVKQLTICPVTQFCHSRISTAKRVDNQGRIWYNLAIQTRNFGTGYTVTRVFVLWAQSFHHRMSHRCSMQWRRLMMALGYNTRDSLPGVFFYSLFINIDAQGCRAHRFFFILWANVSDARPA